MSRTPRKVAPRGWQVIDAVDYARRAGPSYDRDQHGPKNTPLYKPDKAKLRARITLADPFAKGGPKL